MDADEKVPLLPPGLDGTKDMDLGPVTNPFAPTFDAPLALDKERGPDGLDGRERFVVEKVLEGEDAVQAAASAGYPNPGIGPRLLTTPRVRSALRDALDRAGLNETRIAAKINEGLSAERPVVCDKSIEFVPDHSAQHRYLTTLLELRGDLDRKTESEDSWETVLFAVRSRRTRGSVDVAEDP